MNAELNQEDGAGHGKLSVGARLKAAREAAGKTIADVSADTRVSKRLLDALERDAIDELPRGPYAIGFAKTYAQAVGLNEDEISDDMRALQLQSGVSVVAPMDEYEPVDASRVPPKALAWAAAAIAVALVIGYLVWRSVVLAPSTGDETAIASEAVSEEATPTATAAAPAAAPAAFADNAVVRITASGPVWFSLENAEGRSQFDLTLNSGEFYTIKPEQRGLFLRTGRPQVLRLMVGEQTLPQLGAPDTIVSHLALDGASLARIAASPPVVTNAPATAPATMPTR